jgi:hypothetical protein
MVSDVTADSDGESSGRRSITSPQPQHQPAQQQQPQPQNQGSQRYGRREREIGMRTELSGEWGSSSNYAKTTLSASAKRRSFPGDDTDYSYDDFDKDSTRDPMSPVSPVSPDQLRRWGRDRDADTEKGKKAADKEPVEKAKEQTTTSAAAPAPAPAPAVVEENDELAAIRQRWLAPSITALVGASTTAGTTDMKAAGDAADDLSKTESARSQLTASAGDMSPRSKVRLQLVAWTK